MIRRTLALLGATALAVTGLAGPASASDPGVAQINVSFAPTGVDGTGVQADLTSPHTQAWFELKNLDESSVAELESHSVIGCVGANDITPVDFVLQYPSTATIDPGAISRTADPDFTGPAQFRWRDAASGEMNSLDFNLRLVDNLTGNAIAETSHGNPDLDCVSSLPPL